MALSSKNTRILTYLLPVVLALVFFSLSSMKMRRAPWYQDALWNLVQPPQELVSNMLTGVGKVWEHYVALINVQRDREQALKKLAQTEGELLRLQEVVQENERLRGLLNFHDTFPQRTLVARVIANDPRAEFKSITINRGADDGVQPLMPVVGPKGLVGRVGTVGSDHARVLLITDPNSAVDAMVQRSRARGLIVGIAWRAEMKSMPGAARMEYLRRVSDIKENDVVVTSGFDQVYPSGIPVGTVREISSSRYGAFTEAAIEPFEEMSRLQEVMVVLQSVTPPSPKVEP